MAQVGITHDVVIDPEGEAVGLLLRPGGWQVRQANPFAAKLGATERSYADFDDWSVWEQRTWHHGALQENWDDEGMFLDGNLDTRFKGQAILPPQRHQEPAGTAVEYVPGSEDRQRITSATNYYAQSFTAWANVNCTHVWLRLGWKWKGGKTVVVNLRADSAADPGAVLKTKTLDAPNDFQWLKIEWASAQALVSGTDYWIEIHSDDAVDDVDAGRDTTGSYSKPAKISTDSGSTWGAYSYNLYFKVNDGAVGSDEMTGPIVTFKDNEYAVGEDAVFVHDDTNSDWDDVIAGLTVDGTDIVVFSGNLYVAQGNSNAIRKSADGAAWANIGGAGADQQATALCVHGGYLYKSRVQVKYTSDPSAGTPSWSSGIEVGTSDTSVHNMVSTQWGLVCFKPDGAWLIPGRPGQEDRAYRIDALNWSTRPSANNGQAAAVWSDGLLYISEAGGGLLRWDGEVAVPVGPNLGTGLPSDYVGNIVGLLRHTNFLYAVIDGGASNISSLWAYNGGWHRLSEASAAGDRIYAIGFTTEHTPNRLLFGEAKRVAYLEMPDTTDNPLQYSSITYEPTGEMVTSAFFANLPHTDKEFYEVGIRAKNVTADRKFSIYYCIDQEDTWYSLGDVTVPGLTILALSASTFTSKKVGSGSTTTTVELATGHTTSDMAAGDWVMINEEYRQIESITDSDTFVLETALSTAPSADDDVYPGVPWGRTIWLRIVAQTDDKNETPEIEGLYVKHLSNVKDKRVWRCEIKVEEGQEMLNGQPDEKTMTDVRAAIWRCTKKGRINVYAPDYPQSGTAITVKISDWSEYLVAEKDTEGGRKRMKWHAGMSLLEV